MKIRKLSFFLFLSLLLLTFCNSHAENRKAREVGELELSKYISNEGNDLLVKRGKFIRDDFGRGEEWVSKYYNLERGHIYDPATENLALATSKIKPIIKVKDLQVSEADKLNGVEYRGELMFKYEGPARRLIQGQSSEWEDEFIVCYFDITCKNGEWKAHQRVIPQEPYVFVLVPIEDLNNIRRYAELEILEKQILSQSANIENQYNRRVDVVANFSKTASSQTISDNEAFIAADKALLAAKRVHLDENTVNDPKAFSSFLQIQNELSSAISGLLIVVEKDARLRSNESARDAQIMLEGIENRITVERQRYNEIAKAFNSLRLKLNAGNRFKEKQYFRALAPPPKISFFP